MPVRVAVGLGSNQGQPERMLLTAASALERVARVKPLALSSGYVTDPIGPDQPPFLNAALVLDTTLEPRELLLALQGIEAALGRSRGRRWGPRTIDLDLLLARDWVLDDPLLVLPHPRLRERAFALVPLLELWPRAKDPIEGDRYAGVLATLGREGVGPPIPLPRRLGYRRVAHTADMAFVVAARTLPGTIERAAMALLDTLVDRRAVRERERLVVDLRAVDVVELLVGLLSELVYLVDSGRLAPRRASLLLLEEGRARLALYGERVTSREQLRREVKAVTYHGAEVKQACNGSWSARFLIDL